MVLERPGEALKLQDVPDPKPGPNDVLLRVSACGVCRTDLHVVDGDLREAKLPIIPGHEIIGHVTDVGSDVTNLKKGDRVGVPWLGKTCGKCYYCRHSQENLCDEPEFTGYQIDGGYAEMACADARFCFEVKGDLNDAQATPLLCAGLIGYRALRMAGPDAKRIGIYGFGAAAHIVAQIAQYESRDIYAFTRPYDETAQKFAQSLGAVWAGGSDQEAPKELDAAIIFASVGSLVPLALKAVRKGGIVVCGGIHMSPIPTFPYDILWGERVIRSVANLTRQDAREFLELAPKILIRTTIETFPLSEANQALSRLRSGNLTGAAVLLP